MRSPSYNGNDNKYLKSEQIAHKRKVSVEKNASDQYTSPFVLPSNNNNLPPSPYDRPKPGYQPSPPVSKQALDVP